MKEKLADSNRHFSIKLTTAVVLLELIYDMNQKWMPFLKRSIEDYKISTLKSCPQKVLQRIDEPMEGNTRIITDRITTPLIIRSIMHTQAN